LGDAKELLLKDAEYRDMGNEEFLDRATDCYTDWVQEDTYLLMEEKEKFDDYTKSDKVERYGVKAAKRGNAVYRKRTLERFEEVRSVLPDVQFFNPDDRGIQHTPAFFVTLTYDSSNRLVESWDEVGEDYNRFRSRLQREFATRCENVGEHGHRIEDCETCQDARIRQIRVFEGREDGYPAPHALICFDEELPVKYHSKSESWRLASYSLKERIGDCWDNGHVDVRAVHTLDGELSAENEDVLDVMDNPEEAQAVATDGGEQNGGGAIDYLMKYLRKTLTVGDRQDDTHLRTLVMSWLTEKRMFSASSEWDEVMSDTYLPDSNVPCVIQTDLFGEEVSENEITMLGSFVVDTDADNPPPWRFKVTEDNEEVVLDAADA
jgi:hypothetical protein